MGRNPNYETTAELMLYMATNQRVFIIRMNTTVNHGYLLPEAFNEEGHSRVFASSCIPLSSGGSISEIVFRECFCLRPAAIRVAESLSLKADRYF
ncbi:MAG: hypothetical protein M2R45_03090 [Verrucomicrobia subdivision 3 bacterium]|nr:hypothetical protein [Limisphaerales bacterium]MCS1416575.1 hypothetical protein [Limisphaerales bacterium]